MVADDERRADRAKHIVLLAWRDLPAYDRELLRSIGASQWKVRTQALGHAVDDVLRSAGYVRLSYRAVTELDIAAGAWISQLRLVVINAAHPALADLDDRSYEAMLARVAWHEWAHALAVVRATRDDIADGGRLLQFVPAGVCAFVRRGDCRRSEYTRNSSPRSTLCSCRVVAAVRRASLRGSTTRSTNS